MSGQMLTIIISDIFGRTPALEKLGGSLNGNYDVIDPYQGKSLVFTDESHAYRYFIDNIGISHYATLIRDHLASTNQPVEIVAFSVGASAIWQVSADLDNQYINKITCFYGSQIRHQIDIQPKVPLKLILPKMEPHFSIKELANQLAGRKNVELESCGYLHGFMNRLSVNFDELGYQYYLEQLKMSRKLKHYEDK